ncbi:MAG: F0F1 ATP synthase subunit gamma [Candidatus Omnitrophota bacterium]|nr:MAG: F0F1 ATP synthase subunit gamma [Candidatus Omnitrophota bacterium]
MSNVKQLLKHRITSIDKIVKITQAMEVVSLFRLKRIEKQAAKRKDYFAALHQVAGDLWRSVNYAPHKFFTLRTTQNPLLLCIGSDKGLCGGFNLFVLQSTLELIKIMQGRVLAYGRRLAALKRHLSQDSVEVKGHDQYDAEKLAQVVFEGLKENTFDGFFIIFNQFKSNIIAKPRVLKVFPLEETTGDTRDFLWEGENLWNDFFFAYIKGAIEASFLESAASEEFMRVFTMKQAKDNALELKENINLKFHKVRQSMITRELTDLCSMLM